MNVVIKRLSFFITKVLTIISVVRFIWSKYDENMTNSRHIDIPYFPPYFRNMRINMKFNMRKMDKHHISQPKQGRKYYDDIFRHIFLKSHIFCHIFPHIFLNMKIISNMKLIFGPDETRSNLHSCPVSISTFGQSLTSFQLYF